ncbi:MAG: hypothetical protein GY769_18140, partial [bacterium]|nr:hypothetical protein [bacterium]
MKPVSPEGDRMRPMAGRLCGLLIALALLPHGVEAQSASSFDEVGRFYVQNFGPEDYDAYGQNWAVVQGPDGLVYVANRGGVLDFFGVTRRLTPSSHRSAARSLGA